MHALAAGSLNPPQLGATVAWGALGRSSSSGTQSGRASVCLSGRVWGVRQAGSGAPPCSHPLGLKAEAPGRSSCRESQLWRLTGCEGAAGHHDVHDGKLYHT